MVPSCLLLLRAKARRCKVIRPGWVILTRRYGGDRRDPSTEELAAAIRELFVEDLPGITEADYVEHGDASLRYGFDEGPMYVVAIDRLGNATFEEWADQNYETELAPARTLHLTSQDDAVQLWTLLTTGNVDAIRRLRWDGGV